MTFDGANSSRDSVGPARNDRRDLISRLEFQPYEKFI